MKVLIKITRSNRFIENQGVSAASFLRVKPQVIQACEAFSDQLAEQKKPPKKLGTSSTANTARRQEQVVRFLNQSNINGQPLDQLQWREVKLKTENYKGKKGAENGHHQHTPGFISSVVLALSVGVALGSGDHAPSFKHSSLLCKSYMLSLHAKLWLLPSSYYLKNKSQLVGLKKKRKKSLLTSIGLIYSTVPTSLCRCSGQLTFYYQLSWNMWG